MIFCHLCIHHSTNYLEEIINIRTFGITDLWANIGGYVGTITGISIIQILESLCCFMVNIKTKCRKNTIIA